DEAGPFDLIVRTSVGPGELILVADTGLFMNEQALLPGYANREYVAALVASILPRDGVVLVDESRHAPPAAYAPLAEGARALGRATSNGPAPWILLALLAGATAHAWRLTRDTEDWSHHAHDLAQVVPAPEALRPDAARLMRLARRRVSERYNMPLEQVAAMTTEQLHALTGDRTLAEAATGSLRADPAPLFSAYAPVPSRSTEVQP
ncbi:MAG TPA: hypothetical protein VHH36_08315, partial [Candidatus Thermoplasmatota archaeon]|nr:hypothetical protein [Candidatus Thermoplasmatota archaeon]